jgi:hypothetical protein
MTSAGERSLQLFDSFGFTYENSIIYMTLALCVVAFARATNNFQFIVETVALGKVAIACLLFLAKFEYCICYMLICLIVWLVIPYPKFRGENKFI